MGKLSVRVASGSTILGIGQIIATLIGGIMSIAVARLLGPSDYGLMGIALSYPLMIANLADLGFSTALARYASFENNRATYVWSGLLFRFSIAISAGFLVFLLREYIASILARPYIAPLINILAIYTSSYIIMTGLTSVYNGLGKYHIPVAINIAHYVGRGALSILLILLGFGISGVATSFAVVSLIVTGSFSVLLLRYLRDPHVSINCLKEMLLYSMPLFIPYVWNIPLSPILNTILAINTGNYELGNYTVASNLITALDIIVGAISTALLTSLPMVLNDKHALRDAIQKAHAYTSIILPGLSFLVISLAEPVVLVLYGELYAQAPLYLSFLALNLVIPALLGSVVIGNFFLATGKTSLMALVNAVSTAMVFPIALVLIPRMRVVGIILSYIIAGITSTLTGLFVASRRYGVKLDITYGVRGVATSLIPAVLIRLVLNTVQYHLIAEVFFGVTIYGMLYLAILPFFVEGRVILELADIIKQLKFLGPILKPFLNLYCSRVVVGLYNKSKT